MRAGGSTSVSGGAKPARVLGILTILYALFLGYLLTAPLLEFSGVVSGEISLLRYSLTYYGSPIRLESLDAVRAISLLVLAEAAFLLLSGAYIVARPGYRGLVRQLVVSALLLSIAYLPLPLAILRIVEHEALPLSVSLRYESSAGIVDFGSTRVFKSWILSNSLAVFIVSIAYIATTGVCVALTERERQKSANR